MATTDLTIGLPTSPKQCKQCLEVKDATEFPAHRHVCKLCVRAQRRLYDRKNRPKINAAMRRWNRTHRDEILPKRRLASIPHRAKQAAAARARRTANPEKVRQQSRASWQKHAEKRRADARAKRKALAQERPPKQQPTHKQCSKCLEIKEVSAFPPKNRRCKECSGESRRAYYAKRREHLIAYGRERAAKNQEQRREKGRAYYAAHPEEMREKARAHRRANPEKTLRALRIYAATHVEELREKRRNRRANNPDLMRKQDAAHRARRRNAPKVVPIRHIDIAERDNWTCHICHKKVTRKNWSLDHLHELSKGGSHIPENVALAHVRCNSRRGARGKIPVQMLLLGEHPKRR